MDKITIASKPKLEPMSVHVLFTEADVTACCKHITWQAGEALESIEGQLKSYIEEVGAEIMYDLLISDGWGVDGWRHLGEDVERPVYR